VCRCVLPAIGCLRGRPRGRFTAVPAATEVPPLTAEAATAAATTTAGRDDDVDDDVVGLASDVADRWRVSGFCDDFFGDNRFLAAGINLTSGWRRRPRCRVLLTISFRDRLTTLPRRFTRCAKTFNVRWQESAKPQWRRGGVGTRRITPPP